MITTIEPKTMSITDYALRWGISRETMRDIVKSHPDFPALKLKRKLLVIVAEADKWIVKNLQRDTSL